MVATSGIPDIKLLFSADQLIHVDPVRSYNILKEMIGFDRDISGVISLRA